MHFYSEDVFLMCPWREMYSTSTNSSCNLIPPGQDSWESLGVQGDLTSQFKGYYSWICNGRTEAEAEAPVLWRPDVKNWLIGKDPHAGKDWRQEEKGTTENEMVGWHHWLNGHGIGWTPGVGDGPGGLVCCASWGCKELDMTEQLNWTERFSKGTCRRPNGVIMYVRVPGN